MQQLSLGRQHIKYKFEIIESQLAWQEINIEEIHQTMISLQLEIDKYQKQMHSLVEKLKEIQLSVIAHISEDMLPPHY
ncbi:Protein SlyX [Candidatus Profftia lariciata]|uniref:SlyX family protein n=1 Tax=Candidatus Profftia lariciata TaxID=1987921 RepID=UPI001D012449|nr:SlyX family protein [Candidatus Profftia lariciata]UDG81566.1 Protein SlyX [Candidatus Profftia lariciata]